MEFKGEVPIRAIRNGLARVHWRVLPKLNSTQWKPMAKGTEEGMRMFGLNFPRKFEAELDIRRHSRPRVHPEKRQEVPAMTESKNS